MALIKAIKECTALYFICLLFLLLSVAPHLSTGRLGPTMCGRTKTLIYLCTIPAAINPDWL